MGGCGRKPGHAGSLRARGGRKHQSPSGVSGGGYGPVTWRGPLDLRIGCVCPVCDSLLLQDAPTAGRETSPCRYSRPSQRGICGVQEGTEASVGGRGETSQGRAGPQEGRSSVGCW